MKEILAFCPTITENKLRIIPYLYNRKKWTGWDDLNPRPQLQQLSKTALSTAHLKEQRSKENFTAAQIPPAPPS